MKINLDVRRLARESAESCASIVMLAPAELREKVVTDLLLAFANVCKSHGVDVTPADIDYYAALINDYLKWAGTLESGSTLH
jgi:hypothetical protein